MTKQTPVMRICISCRKTYDRKHLIKITKDHKQGIMFQKGMGRSAYICNSKKCYSDSDNDQIDNIQDSEISVKEERKR